MITFCNRILRRIRRVRHKRVYARLRRAMGAGQNLRPLHRKVAAPGAPPTARHTLRPLVRTARAKSARLCAPYNWRAAPCARQLRLARSELLAFAQFSDRVRGGAPWQGLQAYDRVPPVCADLYDAQRNLLFIDHWTSARERIRIWPRNRLGLQRPKNRPKWQPRPTPSTRSRTSMRSRMRAATKSRRGWSIDSPCGGLAPD